MSVEPNQPNMEGRRDVGLSPAFQALPPEHYEVGERPTDYRRYVSAVFRYKWVILGLMILGGLFGIVATRFVPATFQAQVTIWIDNPNPGGRGGGNQDQGGPIRPDQLLPGAAWVDLLRSFVVLDTVVKELRLYIQPGSAEDREALATIRLKERFMPGQYKLTVDDAGRAFTLEADGRGLIQRGQRGDSAGADIGFIWVPAGAVFTPNREVNFRVIGPRDAAIALQGRMRANLPRDANFIRLDLSGAEPRLTARTINAVADRFVAVAAQLKREKLSEVSAILREQMLSAQRDLTAAEMALQSFRVGTITLPSERATPVTPGLEATRDPVFQRFFDMRIERENLQRDREAVERAIAMLPDTSGAAVVALEGVASVRAATEISSALTQVVEKRAEARALRQQFSSEHAPLRRIETEVLELETRTIPALARALVSQLQAREQELNQRVNSATQELRQIPPRAIEEARRSRDMEIADNLYTMLQQRYEEARLAEVSSIPDVRILDRAVAPEVPTRSRTLLLVLGGIAGGVGMGIAIALLLDRLDSRLRYPAQVTDDLGLPILGAIPRFKSNSRGRAHDDNANQVVESLRTIRLNVVHAYGTAGPMVTAITSPGVGDGKSFLASNLATAFGDAGHRTILIDADIRRGSLHRVLKLKRKPGLLDLLSGQATYEDVVQSASPAVDFIGCGTRRVGGPELLASSAMSQLLINLRTRYSAIIIDSAPLGAGVDPLILGSLTGNLLLVLRTGQTDRQLANAKLTELYRLPIRVLGAVLNDVKPEGVYRYYSYLPGYGIDDETNAEPPKISSGKA